MGTSAEPEEDSSSRRDEEWPEAEKAEKLARGAALKWASAVFYRPDKLEGLGHYRSREAQRNSSIQSRLKSTVQSHLEGVSSGLEQLRSAAGDMRSVRRDLCAVRWHLLGSAEGFQRLAPLRAVVMEHAQMAAVVRALPQLSSVHELLAQSLHLLHGQQLLEAHAGLMALERLRDDISSQLHCSSSLPNDQALGVVESFFGGLQELSDALAQQLWRVVGGSVRLVQEDPALFVSAVRIIEREESVDDALLLGSRAHRFPAPGRPKAWRQRFYQVMQETIAAAHFKAAHGDVKGPGLGRHLAALQSDILAELRVVKDLMVQCCPPHYDILSICTRMYHQGLSDHLQDILSRDLDKQEIFMLLSWVLHVYHSPEMMGHPDLLPEVDVSTLGPLVSPEVVEQMERKYVAKVKASVTEWMRRTLEVEFKEWFREEEPEMDHLGFFQSALPVIVMQMLDENIRVASLVTGSLQQKIYAMAMDELEAFLIRLREALGECGKEHQKDRARPKHYISYLLAVLNNNMALRLREALGECGKEHQKDRARPKHYISYLLAVLNNNMALSSSISTLHPGSASLAKPAEIPSSLKTALDRTQKKACRLLLEELLLDLQPLSVQLPSRKWLPGAQLVNSMCEVIDKYMRDFSHVRKPIFTFLLAESEHLVMNHYVRALMEKKMVCRSAEERSQLSTRLHQDACQLRELFHNLGLAESEQTLEVIFALQELIRLQDPALLSLEVLGFMTKYPDIRSLHRTPAGNRRCCGVLPSVQYASLQALQRTVSHFRGTSEVCEAPAPLGLRGDPTCEQHGDEHVSILLDLRGDVSKEVRNVVLEMMAQNPQSLPENYQPIFSNILVPAPELPFCLRKGKCA
ncbi:Exocyst complex component 3-like protein [Chelonia mydas]|uniref:Exocyst complex component 3-like protein n=1 Tax=Chelonia mydas TaxID=8469 RepID=M7ANR7_CHEMY|nr:Exocyst complex component 3-like protein [Chelonia mydas]